MWGCTAPALLAPDVDIAMGTVAAAGCAALAADIAMEAHGVTNCSVITNEPVAMSVHVPVGAPQPIAECSAVCRFLWQTAFRIHSNACKR